VKKSNPLQPQVDETKLLEQWEPRIRAFCSGHSIIGEEREDLEQTFRTEVISASRHFDPTRGVKFTTYCYKAMHNAFITNVKKNEHLTRLDYKDFPLEEDIDTYSVDKLKINAILKDAHLSAEGSVVARLRLLGYSMREISELCGQKYNAPRGLNEARRKMRRFL